MVILIIYNRIQKFCMHKCFNHILISNIKFISNSNQVSQTLKKFKIPKENNEHKNIQEKIVYNSVIKTSNWKLEQNKLREEEERFYKCQKEGAPVIALKYFTEEYLNATGTNKHDRATSTHEDVSNQEGTQEQEINFPYKIYDNVNVDTADISQENDTYNSTRSTVQDKPCSIPKRTWMNDYNKYAEVSVKQEQEEAIDADNVEVNYGSADPSIPASSVPCGGCGAHLHCKDPSIPGYLPREIFAGQAPEQLQALVCQRCHFLRQYNTALSVSVDPAEYPRLLATIKDQFALVVLVVDITDFPCSIYPGILDIIGKTRPLVVVGNKVDLLQDYSLHMLRRARQALEAQLPRNANVRHTALVSAKTGFGIEDLITTLYDVWEYKGDVYLVGCTNVGKSMLFNALLGSDYCRTRAVDLVQRATVAPWPGTTLNLLKVRPGTTLNLLKFPITRPDRWRLASRSARLKNENTSDSPEGKIEPIPQKISQIKRTYAHSNVDHYTDDYRDDPFALPKLETLRKIRAPGSGLDPADPVLAQSRWLYDTPGVVTSDQIIDLLTTEELMLTLPREPLVPRTFSVWAGQSLLVGGLGRVDYVDGAANIKMTVLAAATLPVTICFTCDAAEVYSHYLGSEVFAVPCGGEERLRLWPGLSAAEEFTLKGIGWSESCGDIVLSSAGWVAVTAPHNVVTRLRPWTPGARGAHVRVPPLLPRAVSAKGQRMYKSQAYAPFNDWVKERKKKLGVD